MTKIFIFSGAGISQSAGLKTFRGNGGLWNDHKIEDICDLKSWEKNYDLVHSFYNGLRKDLENISPTFSHLKIKEWSEKYDIYNITTNVDDLFDKAEVETLYLHGKLKEVKCSCCKTITNIGYLPVKEAEINHTKNCQNKNKIKPNVVFFNENAPNYSILNYHLDTITDDDIIITIGASMIVVPFDSYLATKNCLKININPCNVINPDYSDWIHINKNSDEGIKIVDEILKERLDVMD